MAETDLVTLTVELADGSTDTITATGNHLFWVESGDELAARPLALQHAGEDDGRYVSSTGGRWVEARHLRLSDRLLSRFSESATGSSTLLRGAKFNNKRYRGRIIFSIQR